MNLERILSEIDLEISRLQQAKHLLSANVATPALKRGPGRPPAATVALNAVSAHATPKRRTMSAAGRARIAAAQKARWAKTKKAAKKAALPAAKTKPGPVKAAKKSSGRKPGRPAGKKTSTSQAEVTPAAS